MPQFRPVSSGFLLVLVLAVLPLAAAPPRGPSSPGTSPAVVEHKVTRGETLWSISQKHHTSVGAIMDHNHLSDHNVREGMTLRIPPNVVESVPVRHRHVHVVKRGEDFWDIADRYDIKPSVLAKSNPNVNPSRIHAGMELIVPIEEGDKTSRQDKPAPRPQPGPMIQHTVTDNDTFYSISRKYGVSMDAVVAANPTVRPERLRGGMKVLVPAKNVPAPQPQPQPKSTNTTTASRGRSHIVKEEESIATIAKKYGVSEAALLRENKLAEDEAIYVDDVLKIPGGGTAVTASANAQPKPAAPPSKPPSPAPQPKPTGNTPSNTVGSDGAIRSYIVSAGEDENTICEAFGISRQSLFDYNRLSPTTKLKPGDEIAIPRVTKGRKRSAAS